MKFLCIHGNGTNSNVMELQIAPLRHELEDHDGGHEYEFVEAIWEAPMAEGIEGISSKDRSFYSFYNPKDLTTLRQSLHLLDHYVATGGPFDAVMGFSAGAVLAALYLAEKQQQCGALPFKCGVFLSSAVSAAEISYLGMEAQAITIQLPTAHIWGSNDLVAPSGGEDISRLFDPALRQTLVHDGGHELPRRHYLTEAGHVIRRTMQLAST
ncbi:hypothetical protein N656DRAFT_785395 [Canariomyces notabilis]|uniref:Serine hydrolase domain-containing protein n=1 Tax=Canariomyces notabilis TaxID=2074819 RepID=A0AAN6QBZ2_9PEZI|nr:hypothetical protein N656DRAFT_785395 [Canariomyces arenarius]